MSRINIYPVTIAGQSATLIDVRIVMYALDSSSLKIFYGYYTSDNKRIQNIAAEGNITLAGSLISGATNTALLSAVSAAVGSVTSAFLRMNQINDTVYKFHYTKSDGTISEVIINGSFVSSTEYTNIKSSILTALGLTEFTVGGTIGVQRRIADNARYNSFGSVYPCGTGKLLYAYRSGTDHLTAGRIEGLFYTVSTDTWGSSFIIATPPSGYDYRCGNGGVLSEEKIIVFSSKYQTSPGTWINMGYFLSSDLTATSWSGYTTLAMPASVTAFVPYGSLIQSDTTGTFYQPCYGYVGSTSYKVWLYKIVYASGAVTISIIDVYSGTTQISETSFARLGGGNFIAIGRQNNINQMMQITSSDGGITWNAPTATNMGVSGANSNACIPELRLCNGFLYCFYMDRISSFMRVSKSNPATVFASSTSWNAVNYIANVNLGYPSMCQIPGTTDTQMITWTHEQGGVTAAVIETKLENFNSY